MLLCLSYITTTDSSYSLFLPFFYQKSVEQKQNMSFVPILAINFGSHRINNCVNIFPSRDYPSCVFFVIVKNNTDFVNKNNAISTQLLHVFFSPLKQQFQQFSLIHIMVVVTSCTMYVIHILNKQLVLLRIFSFNFWVAFQSIYDTQKNSYSYVLRIIPCTFNF